MKLSLNDLKAQVAHTQASARLAATNTQAAAKEAANTFATKTVAVAKSTGSAFMRITPVTNGKFEDIVSGLNARHNETDRDLWKNKVSVHMVAQAAGINLPSDEELNALYDEYQATQQAEREAEEKARLEAEAAKAQAEAAAHIPTTQEGIVERLMASMQQLVQQELAPLAQTPGNGNEALAAAITMETAPVAVPTVEKQPSTAESILGHLSEITDPAVRAQLQALLIGNGPAVKPENIVDYGALEEKHLGNAEEKTGIYTEETPVVEEPVAEHIEEEATVETKPKKKGGRRKLPRQQPIN